MKILAITGFIFLLSACQSGNGEGLNEQGQPVDKVIKNEIEENSDIIQPTLNAIQERIFTPICSGCHGGASPAAGQNLSSIENSIANLINIDSSNPLYKRVLPGSSLESYLYLKITGNNNAGARMPLGQPALDDASILAIKQWIDDGALIPENSVAPVQVSRVTTKVDDKSESNMIQADYVWRENESLTLVIWFNKSMNFNSLTKEQILITAYNSTALIGDYDYFLSNDNIALNIINSHTLELNMSGLERDINQINVQLNKSSISTLTTHTGQELDGNNDGIDGGVFSYDIIF